MPQRKGPTDAQLDAAIEGAKDMPEVSKSAARLVESANDPSKETDGPRGSGYPAIINPDGTPLLDPDEALKRETAVFKPGTQQKDESRRDG
jgi:hypothetical protein